MLCCYPMRRKKLPLDYFQSENTVALSRDLIGKVLCTCVEGKLTAGRIVETEAYCGPEDRACHAYGGRRTKRTETMYAAGGVAYIYLCYGMHHLFNIVSHRKGEPHAILVRAVEPLLGVEVMRERRGGKKRISDGPALVTQALGISIADDGESLAGSRIWLEEWLDLPTIDAIQCGPRIGIDYAGEDAHKPWRFFLP